MFGNLSFKGQKLISDITTIADLFAWWDAQDILADTSVPADSTAVSSYVDKISGFTLAESNASLKPVYKHSVIGGKHAILYDGVNDRLALLDATLQGAISNTAAYTIFAVVKNEETSSFTDRNIIGSSNYPSTSDMMTWQKNRNQEISLGLYNGSAYIKTGKDLSNVNDPHIVSISNDNYTPKVYIDNQVGDLTNPVTTGSFNRFVLGSRADSANNYWLGYIADVVFFTRVLNTLELRSVYQFLKTKYSL